MTRRRLLLGTAAAMTLAALLAALTPGRSDAHGLEPALLVLREAAGGRYEVTWKSSAMRLPGAEVRPTLPARCRSIAAAAATNEGDRIRERWTIDCGADGLTGAAITVEDLAVAKIDALLRIERRDGSAIQVVLTAATPSFTLPAQASGGQLLRQYGRLGIERVLTAPDHLLFVLGLLLLASMSGRFIQTIAAFTVGHSMALCAAALQLGAVPANAVQLLIALSVLALAVELARDSNVRSILRRRPWTIALAFGLLHGLGFAGALRTAGLPPGEAAVALAAFNGGIEIAQLAAVAVVLGAGMALARWRPTVAARSFRPAVYAIGILAAYWCFERAAVWIG